MKEASGNYFYNPNIKTNSNDGDGFYSAGTSTEDAVKGFYKKYLELKEKLKKYDIDIEDEYIDSEKADKIYHGEASDGEWDIEDDEEEYSPMYDNYEERQVDMLSLPVYYHIAFAIPADLSFGSETARRIEAIYKLKPKLEKAAEEYENECEDLEEGWTKAGDVVKIENVYVMFTTNKKYQHPTLDTIRECVRTLAQDCYKNKIQFLAMPRIGCGHGRLDWDVVRELILDEFDNYFYDVGEINWRPYITFCYQ